MWGSVFQRFLSALFPWRCGICEKLDEFSVCQKCLKTLVLAKQKCPNCRLPSPGGLAHPNCPHKQSLDGNFSVFDYGSAGVDKLIVAGKYYFWENIFEVLSHEAIKRLKQNPPEKYFSVDFLVPIPLAKKRQNWRGFNQAETISKIISKQYRIPQLGILKRVRPTKTQKDLDKTEREKNTQGIFQLRTPKNPWYAFLFEDYPTKTLPEISGKSILLIDDVITTGSTLRSAAKTLKSAGAKEVYSLCLASK